MSEDELRSRVVVLEQRLEEEMARREHAEARVADLEMVNDAHRQENGSLRRTIARLRGDEPAQLAWGWKSLCGKTSARTWPSADIAIEMADAHLQTAHDAECEVTLTRHETDADGRGPTTMT